MGMLRRYRMPPYLRGSFVVDDASALFALIGYGLGRMRAPVFGVDGKGLLGTLTLAMPPQLSGAQQ